MVAKPTGEPFFVTRQRGALVSDPAEPCSRAGEFDEAWLQELLDGCPGLLPITDVDDRVEPPLVSLGRELPTEAGPINNLFISRNGQLVVVETKLWRNPQARRRVVAQVLDYAKHVRRWTYSRLCEVTRKNISREVRGDEGEADWIDRVNRLLADLRGRAVSPLDYLHAQITDHFGIVATDEAPHLREGVEFAILQAVTCGRVVHAPARLHAQIVGPPGVGKKLIGLAAPLLQPGVP